jgi:ABC-2 type transport system permease protein
MNRAIARTLAIAGKEVRQLRRDRLTFGMIVGVPLMQILLFGFAINFDVRHLRGAAADLANTARSRELLQAIGATQVVDFGPAQPSAAALEQAIAEGRLSIGVFVPPDFERRLIDGRPAAQILVDGTDPTIYGVARGLAALPFGRPGPSPVFEIRNEFNPERRTAVDVVPALIGVILNMTMVLFTAIAIVREREHGNLELLIVTPVRRGELMIGKIAPYVVIGLVQVTLVLGVAWWVFAVPIRGSLLQLYLAALLFIAASLSLGLLISTAAKNQFQAVQLTVFTFLPSILLSGFVFPFDGMPKLAQWVGELLPLTHFVRLTRGVLLRAAPLSAMPRELAALAVFFAVAMTLAVLKFHKRLD